MKAARFTTLLLNIPNKSTTTANVNTLNSDLIANYASHCDALANYWGDAHIGLGSNTSDPAYYQPDGTHLTNAGYAIVGQAVATALNGM
jgi:lysophospholipase L1-like esterase